MFFREPPVRHPKRVYQPASHNNEITQVNHILQFFIQLSASSATSLVVYARFGVCVCLWQAKI